MPRRARRLRARGRSGGNRRPQTIPPDVPLLDRVATVLSDRGITHGLIGAAALAVHGISRSTLDEDLLVVDAGVLDEQFWQPLISEAQIRVTRGDVTDPLAGVVRLRREGESQVDVIVGRHRWQEEVLSRVVPVSNRPLYVVRPDDLILLKLYAGGSQDRWDIEQLLGVDTSESTITAVDERIGALPPRSREMWLTLRPRRL